MSTIHNGELDIAVVAQNNEYKLMMINLTEILKLNLNLNIIYCSQDPISNTEVCKMLKQKNIFTNKQLNEMKLADRVNTILIPIKL